MNRSFSFLVSCHSSSAFLQFFLFPRLPTFRCRPRDLIRRWTWRLGSLGLVCFLAGCSGIFSHYRGVERSLTIGDPDRAVALIQEAEDEYGRANRLLYLMDYGMVLHRAGRYQESNKVLEKAHYLVEEQYAVRLRDQASALLLNETQLPYEGEPFEHVLINVIQALNYGILNNWNEALVEARRIDHRLNMLSDRAEGQEYKEDPFARYLTGILYEAAGDLNNAYVAYRKAEVVYEESRAWSKVPLPDVLKIDLIRVTQALHLTEDFTRYQAKYAEVMSDARVVSDHSMAELIVVSYHGRSPQKEDLYIDVPISLDALYLVALAKSASRKSTRTTRGGEALLYGIHGQVARVALPRLVPQRMKTAYSTIQLTDGTTTFNMHSQRVYDVGAVAEKNLDDGYKGLVLRAVARTAMKMAAAEGIGIGARSAVNKNSKDWVGPLAAILARIFVLVTEEADIRSWRTLPGEIQLARLRIPAGSYKLLTNGVDYQGRMIGVPKAEELDIQSGEVRLVLQQFLE